MFQLDNQFLNANIPRTIRFTDRLFDELTVIATTNDMSFNMLVLQCCRYAIDHMQPKDSETKT